MYWLDLAIIYFALGAPFGVLRITAKRMATPFTVVRSVSGYLLWPIVAIRNVARFVAKTRASSVAQARALARAHSADDSRAHDADRRQELELLRIEIEKILFANRDASTAADTRNQLYAFREAFFRYHGLKAAITECRMQNIESAHSNSIFYNRHSTLARAACLARRDRAKLEAQLENAHRDLSHALGLDLNQKDR